MPQPIPDRAVVNARSDQLRGMEVPEVVKAEARQAQPREPWEMVTVANVGRVEWATIFTDEQKATVDT